MKWYNLIFYFSAIIGCYACSKQHEENHTLKEKEYMMDEPLSALSVDGDSAFWMGSESGMVWHIAENEKATYEIETGRIYDITADQPRNGSRVCWLGIRNGGLQRWQLQAKKMAWQKTYAIAGKGYNYSVYDIEHTPQALYAATSQGLYRLQLTDDERLQPNNEKLQRIYPLDDDCGEKPLPFVVRKICRQGQWLFACTPTALVRIDIQNSKIATFHQGEKITYAAIFNNMLHVVADQILYIEDVNGRILRTLSLPIAPSSLHQAGNILYLIASNQVVLTQDGCRYVTIPLRHNIPANSSNVVAYDAKQGFTLLLTENALWYVPSHLGVFNTQTPITAACSDGKNAYYINENNELYKQVLGEQRANKVYQFAPQEVITDIHADGNQLYYRTHHQEIKLLEVGDNYFKNELLAAPRTLYLSHDKITDFHLHRSNEENKLFVGVQDGLIVIHDNGIDTIRGEISRQYITSFFQPRHSDMVYMATLNGGIFYASDNKILPIDNTRQHSFLNDVIVTDTYNKNLIMLRQHHILLNNTDDSVKAKDINRFIYVNDSVFYGLPKYGLVKYVINKKKIEMVGRYYEDISFHPHAVFTADSLLFLGSSLGVMQVPIGQETAAQWINFYETAIQLRTIGYSLAVFGAVALLLALGYMRYKQSTQRHTLQRINDLQTRLMELKTTVSLIKNADEESIRRIEKTLNGLQPGKGNRAETNQQLQQISSEIMKKNRNAALLLLKEMDRQMEEIQVLAFYESKLYINNSQNALDTGTTEVIKTQVEQNAQWLTKCQQLSTLLYMYQQNLHQTLSLEGVTAGLAEAIVQTKEHFITHPIADTERDVEEITQCYQHIFSTEAMEKINHYMADARQWLSEPQRNDKVANALNHELRNIADTAEQTERLQLLRTLKHFEHRINQLRTLEKINESITDYVAIHSRIVHENEQRTIKKFDMQLQREIADHTEECTKEIDNLIDQLFADMEQSDPEILTGLLKFTGAISQQGKVLGILMAHPKVKRTLLPGLLGIYGNLNPVVSRLVSGKIKNGRPWLENYVNKHPSSLAIFILRLAE